MREVKKNAYGCTHVSYVSDMTGQLDLRSQLKKLGINFSESPLKMGAFLEEPALVITYSQQETNIPVTVLIIPAVGIDSWCETYYYFPGMSYEDAIVRLDWYEIQEALRML
jgi:hypothetical protein